MGWYRAFLFGLWCCFIALMIYLFFTTFMAEVARAEKGNPMIQRVSLVRPSAVVSTYGMRLHHIERHVGLHERKHRKTIRNIVGVDPVRTPWCGAAVAYAVKKSGQKPVKGYLRAASWKGFGQKVSLKSARKGDIVVYRNRRGYHVAVFKGHDKKGRHISCGGNMSNRFKCSSYRNSSVVAVRR